MRIAQLIACVVFAAFFATTPASADKRVALIVGLSAYKYVTPLANPGNDARLMADTLRGLGFTLVGDGPQLDLDKIALENAVQRFSQQIQGADVALFYYSGHGLQVRGENYLVPVAANPVREADVDFHLIDANLVLRQMEQANAGLNIVILDACRNNPFGGRGFRAINRGLARMLAPESTLISYATQPGNVAQDGDDGNSPYTKALAITMRRPGLDIFRMFNEVGLAVMQATGSSQQPWLASSPIKGDFYLAGAPPKVDLNSEEMTWNFVKDSKDPDQLRNFLQQFPKSHYRTEAEQRVARLEGQAKTAREEAEALRLKAESSVREDVAWNIVKNSKDIDQLQLFLQQFPSSQHRIEVERRVAHLEAEAKKAREDAEALRIKAEAGVRLEQRELARLVQFELKRVGCFDGAVDGEFGEATRIALRTFVKHAATNVPDKLSFDTATAIRKFDKRICPLVCGKNQRIEGERCVELKTATATPETSQTPAAAMPGSAGGLGAASQLNHSCQSGDKAACLQLCNAGFTRACQKANQPNWQYQR